jgi:hypothetical protein
MHSVTLMNDLGLSEAKMLANLQDKLTALRDLLLGDMPESLEQWNTYLAQIKQVTGNLSNDASFVAGVLAKQFLIAHHPIQEYDSVLKPQGAPGLDIDLVTNNGKRVIGEIKTTEPYGERDFGSNQKVAIMNDLRKLQRETAESKYLFVTSQRAYQILQARYQKYLSGIEVVLLGRTDGV